MVASMLISNFRWRLVLLLYTISMSCCRGLFASAFSAIPMKADSASTNPFFGSLVDDPTIIYQEKPRRAVKRPTKPLAKRKRTRAGGTRTTTALLVEAPSTTSQTKDRRHSIEANENLLTKIPNELAHRPKKQPLKKLDDHQSYQPGSVVGEEKIEEASITNLEYIEKPTVRNISVEIDSAEELQVEAPSEKELLDGLLQQQQSRSDLRPKRLRKSFLLWENDMERRKYYQTKLLTTDEEYEFGMKVQFMVRCEEVHRGLAAFLERLPTFVEWAAACGFTEPCDGTSSDDLYEYLRPEGFEKMFEEIDPDHFVGNSIAREAGPGRGCARKESPPPLRLADWYDDSQSRAQQRAYEADNSLPKPVQQEQTPLNRGDVNRFVALLNEGRVAKQRMIESNMRLVVSIAGKYCKAGVSLMDLVQEGSIGLHHAASKYEPKKGFKFSTYASWWIQQAVFRSIAYHSRSIRLPVHVHNLLHQIRKVQRNLSGELRRKPTTEEMAERLGLSVNRYKYMIYLMQQTTSLDSPAYAQNPKDFYFESSDLKVDTYSNHSPEDARTAEQEVDQSLFLKDLNEIMATLEDDERIVINLRYGLRDGLTRSVTSIAEILNRSKTWVRSQECRGLRKLRRPWYEKKLREYQEAFGAS